MDHSQVLALICDLNQQHFAGWFCPSSVMAFVQVESNFNPFARRYEPALDDASYGLMQLLSQTALGEGYIGPVFPDMPDPPFVPGDNRLPGTLYEPRLNLALGMTYARGNWDRLAKRFGRQPTLAEWADSYNRGPGGFQEGSPMHPYVHAWLAARHAFSAAASGASHQPQAINPPTVGSTKPS